jgi:hypothetical protein
MARKRRSVFDKALGGSRRKKGRRGGMLGAYEATSKKSRKGGMERFLNLGKPTRKKRKDWKIASGAARSLSNRLTPTERAQVAQAVDDELQNDPQLSNKVADAKLTGNENFIQRLTRIIRERFSAWGRG